MDWGKVKFFLGEVLRSFTRNAGMQVTAVGTVTITIVMLGLFLFVRGELGDVGNPKILLCDEPTGNLDPSNTTEIMELLQRINLKGTTVVVATHNQAVVDRMRRRVVRLEHGRILHDDERGYYFRGLGQTAVLPG